MSSAEDSQHPVYRSLFPDDTPRPRKRRVVKPKGRSQHRCAAWEKHVWPQVYATDLSEPAEPLTAEVKVADLNAAADLGPLLAACRALRTDEYRKRYRTQQPFHLAADVNRLTDYIKSLTLLGEALWEDALAKRGLRSCVKGIHKVVSGDPPKVRWRVRPWDPNTQRHVTGLEDCYRDTRGEAKDRLIEWWRVERNIDISYLPPAWLVDALGDAHRALAAISEQVGGIGFDVEPEWEDDVD